MVHENGAVFILDEMITVSVAPGGAQTYYGVRPDLSTFGKPLQTDSPSALSADARSSIAADCTTIRSVCFCSQPHTVRNTRSGCRIETLRIYDASASSSIFTGRERGAQGIESAIAEYHLKDYFAVLGKEPNLIYATFDENLKPSQPFRTLFLQETIRRGLLAPSLVVSFSHRTRILSALSK